MAVIAYLIKRNIHAVSETVFGYQCWEKYFVFKILVVLKNNLIYLFLAVLGFHCCVGFSLVAMSKGYFLVVVCGLLIAAASRVEHGL